MTPAEVAEYRAARRRTGRRPPARRSAHGAIRASGLVAGLRQDRRQDRPHVTDCRSARWEDPGAVSAEGQKRHAARRAAARTRGSADSHESRGLFERCITRGVPEGMLPGPYNNNLQVIQTPGYVVLFTEMIHDARIVPMDGRPHAGPHIRQWLGDSRGHWEGDTLVVDTINFTDKTSFRGSGANLHLVERFTRSTPTRSNTASPSTIRQRGRGHGPWRIRW